MDGVVELTIALCGCKVLCSFLCLPVFKASISSVSLCCVSLLLFTDLSITMFLVYLWSAAPRPMFFHSSSDVIALRFMLFLSDMYQGVLMLTPLLVVVELLVRLLWGGKSATPIKGEKEAEEDVDGDIWKTGGRKRRQKGEEKNNAALFKAFGFLSCLMLWFMCGTYAGFSWRHQQVVVRSCLEAGSLLSTCLPCLLTASSPVSGQIFWATPAAVLLLAFTAVVNLIVAKLSPKTFNPELMGRVDNVDSLQQRQRCPPTPERTSIATVSISHNCSVDSEKTANSCAFHSSHNNWQPAHGKPELLFLVTEQADGCKSNSESVTLVLQAHRTTLHPRSNQLWQTVRESPRLRGELITGLLCGLLVWVLPTVLSTNVLLVSSLDTLAVYVVKHLLSPLHD